MRGPTTRALVIAEAANPEWASVPLVGWSLATAIARATPAHLVTHVRNREAILRAGLAEGRDFTAIDSEAVARPLWRLGTLLRGGTGTGWTTATAFAALAYYYFEHRVWQRFGARIRAREFDVVHRVTPLSPTAPSLIAARSRRAGVPFVLGPINGGVPWPRGFDAERRREREWLSYVRGAYRLLPGHRSTLESASAILCGSLDTLAQVPARHRGKCFHLPENAVDRERFGAPGEARPSNPPRACFVGRLVPYKGPDMALEALAPLLREGRLALDVVGDGPLMPALRELARRESVEQAVTFHGWVEHRTVRQLMARCALLAFPSVREFGGGVVLEAMAMGVVPVVVDYAGPGELVSAGWGRKVLLGARTEIVAGLREAVRRLLDSPEELAALSRAARERVARHFTWEAKAAQVLDVYAWVLGRRPAKPGLLAEAA